ncbi:NAD(P)H-binding protein [Actinoplanes sp. NPDC051411]|jgi:putative NADH-flavin reductase|uniref:NAD(P)-dependent oxidoreductase n=1 Tax=Actinoplanes sp. NPDC051411 TaxID=3155522 RepID=UPI00342749BA
MRVAVFGATGGTGRTFLHQAEAAGHRVTALVRRPGGLPRSDAVRVVRGDVGQADAVREVVRHADVVVSALGIGMHRHATTVYSIGTAAIRDAMAAEGVERLLVVSTTSLQVPSPRRTAEWMVSRMLHVILRAPYADMSLMERTVRNSTLQWTLVRAARLTNGPATGRYRVAYDAKLAGAWSISRGDVAGYLLTHLTAPDTYRRTAELAY